MQKYTAKRGETEFSATQDEIESLFIRGRKGEFELYGYEIEGELFKAEDVTQTTVFQIESETFEDECEAQEKLESLFVDYIRECIENSGKDEFANDIPAIREAFNVWSDDLQREGRICDDSGNRLALSDDIESRIASGLQRYKRFTV